MQSSITFHIQSLEIVKCIATHVFTVNVEASEMNFFMFFALPKPPMLISSSRPSHH